MYEKTWKERFEDDKETIKYWTQTVTAGRSMRINIDLFLQSFLIIKKKREVKVSNLFKDYKSYLKEKEYTKDPKNKKKRKIFIQGLIDYAKCYRENIKPDVITKGINKYSKKGINKDSKIDRLNVVIFGQNTTTFIPYMLYILKEVEDEEERNNIFSLLESYIMRRFICGESTKHYNKLFASLINKDKNVNELKTKFKSGDSNIPSDDDIKESFKENSKLVNNTCKTILYLIEKSIRDGKKHSTLLKVLRNTKWNI